MKKTIALISIVLLMAWAGVIVADTTFSWSSPASQSGTMQYTGLTLNNPTISNATVSVATVTTLTNTTAKITTATITTANVTTNVITVLKVGAQTGWTGVVTNHGNGITNLMWIGQGVVTNVTYIP